MRNMFITLPCSSSGITFERSTPPQGWKTPTQHSKTRKAERMGTTPLQNTGTSSAHAPTTKHPTPRYSAGATLSSIDGEKRMPPSEMHVIMLANTRPVGSLPPCSAPSIVGTHMKTNEYMEPSNSALTEPRRTAFLSVLNRFHAAALLSASLLSWAPKFSGQNMTKTRASAVRAMAAWKGPISPRWSAQTCARIPATMAERPLMKDALLNVSATQASGKPRFRCSATIHDSKPVNKMQVVMPPRKRETHRIAKLLKCSQMLIRISSTK
mmetsp:Transcript_493/g.1538  ORF Transcript_493/g.1538 Transcript_493/m.1538 type:complete len:268 (+) Transcript_493:210-1013(+)